MKVKNIIFLVAMLIAVLGFASVVSAAGTQRCNYFLDVQFCWNASIYLIGDTPGFFVNATGLAGMSLNATEAADMINLTINSSVSGGFNISLNESGNESAEGAVSYYNNASGIFNITVNVTSRGAQDVVFNASADDASQYFLYAAAGGNISFGINGSDAAVAYAYIDQAGTVEIFNKFYGSNKTFSEASNLSITVTDMGMNLNFTKVDTINVSVYSTTDSVGIVIYLNESGVDTGIFNVTVNASGSVVSKVNISTTMDTVEANADDDVAFVIKVSPGDHLNVTYNDTQNSTSAFFNGNINDSGRVEQTAIVDIINSSKGTLFSVWNNASQNYVNFTVTDQGFNLNVTKIDTVVLNLSTGTIDNANADLSNYSYSILITLNESSVDSGIFEIQTQGADDGADFLFNFSSTVSEGENSLNLSEGGNITAYLINETGIEGAPVRSWGGVAVDTKGTVEIFEHTYGTNKTFVETSNLSIRVIDMGANLNVTGADIINVTLRSTTNSSGITVYLNETGASTGIFNITVNSSDTLKNEPLLGLYINSTSGFKTTEYNVTSKKAMIGVDTGDHINVTYADMHNFTTHSNYIHINDSGRVEETAIVKIINESGAQDFAVYYNTSNNYINFTVIDQGFNLNVSKVDEVIVNVSTGTIDDKFTYSILITLNESSVDSGVFDTQTQGAGDNPNFIFNFSSTLVSEGDNSLNLSAGGNITAHVANDTSISGTTLYSWDAVGVDKAAVFFMYNGSQYTGQNDNIFAEDSNISISVTDMGANVNVTRADTISLTLFSTTDTSGITIYLNETGHSTGIFNITINSTTVAKNEPVVGVVINSTSGFVSGYNDSTKKYGLLVSAGDHINMTYTDLHNYTTSGFGMLFNDTGRVDQPSIVRMINGSGSQSFAANNNSNDNYVNFSITDQGFNLNASVIDTLMVNVSGGPNAASYTASVVITMNESAVDSGIFNIQTQGADDDADFVFSFNTSSVEILNSINLTAGGNVTAYVINDSGVTGIPAYSSDTLAVEPNNASFEWTNTTYTRFDLWKLNHTATPTIWINDTGRNLNESVVDQLSIKVASSLGETITFTLNESSANSGIFNKTINSSGDVVQLTFTNTTGQSSNDSLTLSVAESGTRTSSEWVRLYYDDTKNFDTTDPAEMYNQSTIYDYGSAQLGSVVYFAGDASNITITVIDLDMNVSGNVDQVNVTVWSVSDTKGINITLNESTATSGIFNVTAGNITGEFNKPGGCRAVNLTVSGGTFTGNCTLTAQPGEKIYVTYPEHNPRGNRQSLHAYVDKTATVIFTDAKGDRNTTFSLADTIYLKVNDTGNNTRITAKDSVTLKVNSSTDGGGIYVNISEKSIDDNGVFNVSDTAITFSTSASSNATNTLLVAAGDTIWAEYMDYQTQVGGTSRVVNTSVIYGAPTITLNHDYSYNLSTTIIITVTDPDANLDPDSRDYVNVSIYSNMNTTGISCFVNESDANTGVFNISTFGFKTDTDNDPDACLLGVLSGDTIYVRYNDNKTGDVAVNVTDEAVINIEVTLNSGWDLFSTPYTLDTSWDSVADVFGGIDVNKTSAGAYLIYRYNGSTGLWSALASTDNFAPLNGYAVKMNADDTVYLTPKKSALAPSVTTPTGAVIMTLYAGYNFIGSNYMKDTNLTTALNTLEGSEDNQYYWNHILEYDTNQLSPTTKTSSENLDAVMKNGSAYWIYMNTERQYEGLQLR